MKKSVVLVLFTLLLASCGVDNEALKNEVLDTHDEVMPKMGQLMSLKKKVIAKAASLEQNDSTNTEIASLRDIALELDKAHQGMMDWMHGWSENAKPYINGTATKEETTTFYQSEQEKVDRVKADINNSIAKAQEALQ